MNDVKDQIISIAKDKWNHQCHPVLTNDIHPERAFRVPDDGRPIGFCFLRDTKDGKKDGVSVEVHQTHVRNVRINGTTRFRHVPVLLIIGIRHSDLTARVIAKGVQSDG